MLIKVYVILKSIFFIFITPNDRNSSCTTINWCHVSGNKTVLLLTLILELLLEFCSCFLTRHSQTTAPFVGHQKYKVHLSHLTEGKEANRSFGYHSNRRLVLSGRSVVISFPGETMFKKAEKAHDWVTVSPRPVLFISHSCFSLIDST